ncbi:probable sucrose-phosphate synthase 1 [Neltuma alba]|uniref:probable sucrose-phosphate synthase 1 n=1 Tax=Neltuma alba TaxID=207710 RepID=UPI0010A4B6A0|nr:probable sucrose-phosphate synthase 1 [Prosopis alba]
MAGNDWINSYLEAILDVGPGIDRDKVKSSLLLRERGRFNPTRFFVEEVITGFDETDLHRSWIRAASMGGTEERNTRMENMSWRIWNLARKKKQVEADEARYRARRRLEREKAHREAAADMSEDLSEGEKGDALGELPARADSIRGRLPRVNSIDAMENWVRQHKEKKLYIVLISLHGLIRGENMELGRDSDTGGQVKYVVELARALGMMPGVYRVDLLTRQVSAPDVDRSYREPIEMLNPRGSDNSHQERGGCSGAYIVRIPFGPKDKYIPKERLWPYIPEFVDDAMKHIIQMSKVLSEHVGVGEPVWPAAIHGHYADAGDSAALLSGSLNVPMIFTGHSLGRDKLDQLLKQGRHSREEINATYKIMRRIEAEDLTLDVSEIVITSTRQEIEEQWRLYDGFDPVLESKLRARMKRGVSCHGRFMPRMVVIPPGMELNHIVPPDLDEGEKNEDKSAHDSPIWSEIMRFFSNPRKPMILALARPDPKKNLTTLVKAFGECRPLRELANLTLIMGNRDDIEEMSTTNASVLFSILRLIDKYDLYGQVAYPKHHKQSEVPDIYRLAARSKGVFINPAFIEPFGLTLIEAAAHGLPIVATKNGGPVDIHRVLDNGLLIDPHDQQAIADALFKLVSDKQLWAKCRQNGLKNIHLFSWPEHCKTYLARIATLRPKQPKWQQSDAEDEGSESDSPRDSSQDVNDLSLDLKISLDGGKTEESVNLDNALDIPKQNTVSGKSKREHAALTSLKNVVDSTRKVGTMNKEDINALSKSLSLRRRKYVFLIACDDIPEILGILNKIMKAVLKDRNAGMIGFILSTSLTITEINSLIASGNFKPSDFDVLICNSGGELYYPSATSEKSSTGLPFVVDSHYQSHTDYRWGGEDLRKTLVRWVSSINDKRKEELVISEDEAGSTAHCYAFKVKDPTLLPPVRELRKLLRIQALRCNVIYCQNGTRLNVIPVLASRCQALRYLYVRWGMDLSNAVVFVGECGDTDYEGLVGGIHKTVILKGYGNGARKLHDGRSYPLEDVLPQESASVVQAEIKDIDDIRASLKKLGIICQ